MKLGRIARATMLLATIALLTAACGGTVGRPRATRAHAAPAPVIATVGPRQIRETDLDAFISEVKRAYRARGRAFPARGSERYRLLQAGAIEFLVREARIEEEATRAQVEVSSQQVDQAVEEFRDHVADNGGDFGRSLRANGMSVERARTEFRKKLLRVATFRHVVANAPKGKGSAAMDAWTARMDRELAPVYASRYDPKQLRRGISLDPKTPQRSTRECNLKPGTYTYERLVKLGCAGDFTRPPGMEWCPPMLLGDPFGITDLEIDSGYEDYAENRAPSCMADPGDDVITLVGEKWTRPPLTLAPPSVQPQHRPRSTRR